jgi:hypothetical protein
MNPYRSNRFSMKGVSAGISLPTISGLGKMTAESA